MKIVFMGTAEFACPSLEALAGAREHTVAGVVTQPDRPSGRELRLTPSPVKRTALKHHFPIFQPDRVREKSFIETLRYLKPELIVVIAYGQILPKEILELPRHGCINLHGSLLPKHRGASPIQAALLHGDKVTGVTTMFMDEGLDTGDILLQEKTRIKDEDNAQSLHDRLAPLGAKLLLETIELIARGKAVRKPQDHSKASVCKKLKRENGKIDWTMSAEELWNRVRAYNPWPTAFTYIPAERRPKLLKIWKATVTTEKPHPPGTVVRLEEKGITVATGKDALLIEQLQLEGGRRMSAKEFFRGRHLQVGTVLI